MTALALWDDPQTRLLDEVAPLLSPAMHPLYDFQVPLRDQILACIQRRVRGVLLELTTGGGKTTTAMSAARMAIDAGLRGLWSTHRRELIHQSSARASAYGLRHGLITPDSDAGVAPFNIGSIDTLRARLPRLRPWMASLDFIVVDEVHHIPAAGWRNVVDAAPQATLVGLTATPWRLDGKPLGDFFQEAIRGPAAQQLEAGGFLAPVKIIAPPAKVDLSRVRKRMGDFVVSQLEAAVNTDEMTQAAILAYAQHAGGIPTIAYCTTVKHAEDCAAAFTAAGWSVDLIEGKMKKGDRDRAILGLANGRHQLLFSVDCVSEGVDVPIVGAGLSLRPTASTGLFLQQIGRLRRIYPGKTHAIWLDLVGNWTRHGMPNADRQWSLSGGLKGLERAVAAVRRCGGCHFVCERGPERCPNCNRKYPVRVQRPGAPSETVLAALPGFSGLSALKISSMPLKALLPLAQTREQLEMVASIKSYRRGWVDHVLNERRAALWGGRRYG